MNSYSKAWLQLQKTRQRWRPSQVPHRTRPPHAARHPVHVTWRIVRGLPSLRRVHLAQAVGRTIRNLNRSHAERGSSFRVIHFSIQADHLHLIVEAKDKPGLTAGLRGLGVWIARRVNLVRGASGRVLAERYHARPLTAPRQVRNAIVYVLHNHKKHELHPEPLDRFSSARWFDGWAEQLPEPGVSSPVLPPNTRLAARSWRYLGRISVDEWPWPADFRRGRYR
jgi:REP-associated tyrosine transposase